MQPEPHVSDAAAADAEAGMTHDRSGSATPPAVAVKSEPSDEATEAGAAAAGLAPAPASGAADSTAEPAANAAADPPAAADADAPPEPLSHAQYADRIAQGLECMLRCTHHLEWRAEMLAELGVDSTEKARLQIREMLEELLQLHAPAPTAAAAEAASDHPRAATSVKKQEAGVKLENGGSVGVSFASPSQSTILSSFPPSPPFSDGFAAAASASTFGAGAGAASSLASAPSSSAAAAPFGSFSSSSAHFDSASPPPPSPVGAEARGGGGASAGRASLSLHSSASRAVAQPSHSPAPARSAQLHSSLAPMSLCSLSPSPPPDLTFTAATAAAAASFSSSDAGPAFVPRVLPKRSAADLFK